MVYIYGLHKATMTLNLVLGRYVDRDMLVNLPTNVYRLSDGRHIDRLSADISVKVSADTRPIR